MRNIYKLFTFVAFLFTGNFAFAQQQSEQEMLNDVLNRTAIRTCSHSKQHNLSKIFSGTQSFAGQNIDLVYTRMEWNVNPAIKFISGKITPYFKALSTLNEINFEKNSNLTVDSIIYHGTSIPHTDSATYLLNIYFPGNISQGSIDSVSIYYHGTPTSTGFGSFEQSNHNGSPIIWTLSEPYGAQEWWPSKNDLSDKIDSIDVFVSCPNGNRAASNGVLVSEHHTATTATYHWKHRYPIATYLVAIAVTNYAIYSDYVQLASGQLQVLNYVYPEDSASIAKKTPNVLPVIQLYSQLFIEYPFMNEKYGHAQFGWGGGMEHQTMSFMGSFSYAIMAHELAHQWFVDMVTCGSWHDIWLNEGFATYLTGLAYESTPNQPWWELWKKQTINHVTADPDGSVYCDDTTSVSRIFNSRLSYEKGSYVLHMLRWVIGDSAFFAGIRNYLTDSSLAYSYAKTSDLKQHLESSGDTNLTEFFNDWYYGQGYPFYNISYFQKSEDTLQVTLNQTPSHNSVNFFEMPVPIKVRYPDGSDTTFVLDNTSNGQTFNLSTKTYPDTVAFDPERHLLCLYNVTSSNVGLESTVNNTKGLFIFPNPTRDIVNIRTTNQEILEVCLLDAQGKVLVLKNFNNVTNFTKINLNNFATGYYFLRIRTPDAITMKQILKQ